MGSTITKGHLMEKTRFDGIRLLRSEPETYSVPEAGRIVGLGRNSSYEAARRGELPVLHFGRILRVPRVALQRMLEKGSSQPLGLPPSPWPSSIVPPACQGWAKLVRKRRK